LNYFEQFYKKALDALNSKAENTLAFEYGVCPTCGNTYEKAGLEEKFAFCQAPKEKFIII